MVFADYIQVLLGILFLALLYSAWQLRRQEKQYSRKMILPATSIVARARILHMEPLAVLWNNNRVYTVKLLVIPPVGNPFINETRVVRHGEKLKPIHDGIVIAMEYTNRQKQGKVWIRSLSDKNHSINNPHDSSAQNDGSLNCVLKGP